VGLVKPFKTEVPSKIKKMKSISDSKAFPALEEESLKNKQGLYSFKKIEDRGRGLTDPLSLKREDIRIDQTETMEVR
jgi:hypothetical protein